VDTIKKVNKKKHRGLKRKTYTRVERVNNGRQDVVTGCGGRKKVRGKERKVRAWVLEKVGQGATKTELSWNQSERKGNER